MLGRQADVERGDVASVRALCGRRPLREHDRVAPGAEVDAYVRPDRGWLAVHDERAHAGSTEVTGRAGRARLGLRRATNRGRRHLALEERERRHLRRGVRRRELAGARRGRGDRTAPGDDVHAREGARVPEGDGVDRRRHDGRRGARAAGHDHLERKCLRGCAAVPRRGLRPGDARGQREREERQCNREPLPHRAIDSGTGIYRPPNPSGSRLAPWPRDDLDRDPLRARHRARGLRRGFRCAPSEPRPDDGDRAHGRRRRRSRTVPRAPGGDRDPRLAPEGGDARGSRVHRLLPRRAPARPPPPRRTRGGARSQPRRRARSRCGRDPHVHRRARNRDRVQRRHRDRRARLPRGGRARLRRRVELRRLRPSPGRDAATCDLLARDRRDRAVAGGDRRRGARHLRGIARRAARGLRRVLPLHGRDRPAPPRARAPFGQASRRDRGGILWRVPRQPVSA